MAYIDLMALALAGFVSFAVLLVLPTIESSVQASEPGNLSIEIRWPDGVDTDLDLWVQAPGDRPVGYSNRAGQTMNLLRDDLGQIRDTLGLNFENAYSRGIPDGEWIVNLHLYRNAGGPIPLPVSAQITLTDKQGFRHVVWSGDTAMIRVGQETTIARFSTVAGVVTTVEAPTFTTEIRAVRTGYGFGGGTMGTAP